MFDFEDPNENIIKNSVENFTMVTNALIWSVVANEVFTAFSGKSIPEFVVEAAEDYING